MLALLLAFASIISLLSAFQVFGVSKDVDQYELFFESLDSGYASRFEPSFVILSNSIKKIVNDFSFYIFCLVLLALSIKFYVLSRFPGVLFGLIFYLLVLFPLHELTQYRVSIALAFVYLSLYLRCFGRGRLFAPLLVVLATSVHYSAAIFIPVVIFWGYLTKPKASLILAYLFALQVLKSSIFQQIVLFNSTLLASAEGEASIFSSRNILLFSVVCIGFLNWKKLDMILRPWLLVSFYGLALWVIFHDLPVFAHRLLEMTVFSYLIWIHGLPRPSRRVVLFLLTVLAAYLAYKGIFVDPLLT